jgi:hypothetical protein
MFVNLYDRRSPFCPICQRYLTSHQAETDRGDRSRELALKS